MTYEMILEHLVKTDERFMILTAENRAALRQIPGRIGNRFLDVGIAEQTMVGMAAGMALRGKIPIIHALASFLTMRAFEFIRTDVGIGALPVKIVGSVAGFLSEANGPTHQAIEDIALMRGIPGMNIFCPSDEQDMFIGLETMLHDPSPCYIRFNNSPACTTHQQEFAPGKAEIIALGTDVNILTYGLLLREAILAAGILKQKGIDAGVINLRTLQPVDEVLLLSLAVDANPIVTLEDHFLKGGLFSMVSELYTHHSVPAHVHPIALDQKWFKPALLPDVLEYEGFTGAAIAERIEAHLDNHDPLFYLNRRMHD